MGAESVWLVDPIDGTKSFVRECPFFSTQIALMRAGQVVVGVSSAPAYGELAWAESGGGAFMNDRPIGVSAIAELSRSIVSTGNLKTMTQSAQWGRLGNLIPRVSRIRGYGDFVHYHLLARGSLEVVIESDVNILDIAALTIIVREAGGTFTDLAGGAGYARYHVSVGDERPSSHDRARSAHALTNTRPSVFLDLHHWGIVERA